MTKMKLFANSLHYTKAGKFLYDNGPKLMVVGGVGMMGFAGVHAVVKTPDYVERIEEVRGDSKAMAIETAKTYGPDILIGVSGAACVLGGNHIIDARRAAATAFASNVVNSFEEYRGRVRDKYGEEADMDIMYGTEEETYTEVVTTKKGKEKEVEKTRKVMNGDKMLRISPYARIFDEGNPNFLKDDPVHNRNFLVMTQNYLNQRLSVNEFVFINEVYIALGYAPTYEGQYIGWSLKKNPNSVIDLGLFNFDYETRRMFWRGDEDAILLDFNVDGVIVDELPREKSICARYEDEVID